MKKILFWLILASFTFLACKQNRLKSNDPTHNEKAASLSGKSLLIDEANDYLKKTQGKATVPMIDNLAKELATSSLTDSQLKEMMNDPQVRFWALTQQIDAENALLLDRANEVLDDAANSQNSASLALTEGETSDGEEQSGDDFDKTQLTIGGIMIVVGACLFAKSLLPTPDIQNIFTLTNGRVKNLSAAIPLLQKTLEEHRTISANLAGKDKLPAAQETVLKAAGVPETEAKQFSNEIKEGAVPEKIPLPPSLTDEEILERVNKLDINRRAAVLYDATFGEVKSWSIFVKDQNRDTFAIGADLELERGRVVERFKNDSLMVKENDKLVSKELNLDDLRLDQSSLSAGKNTLGANTVRKRLIKSISSGKIFDGDGKTIALFEPFEQKVAEPLAKVSNSIKPGTDSAAREKTAALAANLDNDLNQIRQQNGIEITSSSDGKILTGTSTIAKTTGKSKLTFGKNLSAAAKMSKKWIGPLVVLAGVLVIATSGTNNSSDDSANLTEDTSGEISEEVITASEKFIAKVVSAYQP